MQATHNPATDELCEEVAQMRTELGFVLKHVTRGAEKVNAMKYFTTQPPLVDEYYYEEDNYVVNDQIGGFQPNAQGSNQENWHRGQGNQGQNYGNYNREGHYVPDGNYNRDKNFNWGNYDNINDQCGPYVPLQNWEVALRDDGGSIAQVEDMCRR